MAKKVAINGFGRIGRLAFRQLFENPEVEVVAINDLTDPKTLAYLLEFDSAHGTFHKGEVSAEGQDIVISGKHVHIYAERDAHNLPWGKLGVDLVVESTGFYRTKELAQAHIDAGAKKVMISAPAKGDMPTIVFGVNNKDLKASDTIMSGASCTTNSLAPVAMVLDKAFGINYGMMTTVHAVTNDQRLLDLPNKDLRRGRAAAWNTVPTSTGAAIAVSLVLPQLEGKLDGMALRVPVITGSITDLKVRLNKKVTVDEVNKAVKDAIAADKDLAQALEYNEAPVVSSDIIGSTHGAIFDSTLTKIVESADGEQLVNVFSWYDNENSYTSQFVRTALYALSLD